MNALLLVIGKSSQEEISAALAKWNNPNIDLEQELKCFLNSNDFNELGDGHKQQESEKLNIEILIYPTVSMLTQSIKMFLGVPYEFRQIIFVGNYFKKCSSWALKDGPFGVNQFNECTLKEIDGSDTIFVNDLSMFTALSKSSIAKMYKVIELPETSGTPVTSQCTDDFAKCICSIYKPFVACSSLQDSQQTGNLTYESATMYVLPAGAGECAIFGITGFNMIINTGYEMNSCFWKIIRHSSKLDCLAITHVSPTNILGLESLAQKIDGTPQHQIMFCLTNVDPSTPTVAAPTSDLPPSAPAAVGAGEDVANSSVVDFTSKAKQIVNTLKENGCVLSPHLSMSAKPSPFNLYHNIGFGSLDMYPINGVPRRPHDSGSKPPATPTTTTTSTAAKSSSLAFVLVWSPVGKPAVSILVPGDLSQAKIFEGLESLKTLEIIQAPVAKVAKKESTKVAPKATKNLSKSETKAKPNEVKPKVEVKKSTQLKNSASKPATKSKSINGNVAAVTQRLFTNKPDQKPLAKDQKPLAKDQKHLAKDQKPIASARKAKPSTTSGSATKSTSQANKSMAKNPARAKNSTKSSAKISSTSDKKKEEKKEAKKTDPKTTIVDEKSPKAEVKSLVKESVAESEVPTSVQTESCSKEDPAPVQLQSSPSNGEDDSNLKSPTTEVIEINEDETANAAVSSTTPNSLHLNDVDVMMSESPLPSTQRADDAITPIDNETLVFEENVKREEEAMLREHILLTQKGSDPVCQNAPIVEESLADVQNNGISANGLEDRKEEDQEAAEAAEVVLPQAKQEPEILLVDLTEQPDDDDNKHEPSKQCEDQQLQSVVVDRYRDILQNSPLELPTATNLAQAKEKNAPKKTPRKSTIPVSKLSPIVVNMTFIPNHGDMKFLNIDYFLKIRARYYVLSTLEPSVELFNTLLAAKKQWPQNSMVTVIPTYLNQSILYWFDENKQEVDKYKINVSSSASDCSIELFNDTMSAYRVTF